MLGFILKITFGDRVVEQFSITGDPKDYYVAITYETGALEYRAQRIKIRQLVNSYGEFINKVIEFGDNPYTSSLDVSDKIKDFLRNEPLNAQLAFFDTYAQEINAATFTSIDKIQRINSETAKIERSISMSARWIVAVIVLIITTIFIFK